MDAGVLGVLGVLAEVVVAVVVEGVAGVLGLCCSKRFYNKKSWKIIFKQYVEFGEL